MERRTRFRLAAVVCALGVVAFLGLSVYPFHYSPVESATLVGITVALAFVEWVLEDSTV